MNVVIIDRDLAVALADHLFSLLSGQMPPPEEHANLLRRLNDAFRQPGLHLSEHHSGAE
jgi:hypothetical protein